MHTLSQIGVVSGNVDVFAGRALPHYDDTSEPVANRVWSYFHSNCSGCHRPGASGYGGRSNMPDVRFDFTATSMPTHPLAQNLCGVTAGSEDLGALEPTTRATGQLAGDWRQPLRGWVRAVPADGSAPQRARKLGGHAG